MAPGPAPAGRSSRETPCLISVGAAVAVQQPLRYLQCHREATLQPLWSSAVGSTGSHATQGGKEGGREGAA